MVPPTPIAQSFDPSVYASQLAGIFTPGAIMPWAMLIIMLMAPILVITYGLSFGERILGSLSRAFGRR